MSVNFHEPAWSEFLIFVDGRESGSLSKALSLIGQSISGMHAQGIKSRYSDYVVPSSGTARFHIEEGMLWQPGDATYWWADDPDKHLDPVVTDAEPVCEEDEDTETNNTREQYPARFRAARSDASVRAICSQIELVFGLPQGCVLLCKPDGKPIREIATIATLRQRWEE